MALLGLAGVAMYERYKKQKANAGVSEISNKDE